MARLLIVGHNARRVCCRLSPAALPGKGSGSMKLDGKFRVVAVAVMAVLASLVVAPAAAHAAQPHQASVQVATAHASVVTPQATTVTRTKFVQSGDFRTLETFVAASGTGLFQGPAGARIKIHYGISFFGFDSQEQTLDGVTIKRLNVDGTEAIISGRMMISVPTSQNVTYQVIV